MIFLVRLNQGKYSFLIVTNTNIRTIRPANLSSIGMEENKNTGETKVAAINNIVWSTLLAIFNMILLGLYLVNMYADGPAKARITSNTSTNIARDAIFTTILLCGPSACMARFTHF